MTQLLHIHPDNPQLRLVRQVVDAVESGGVIVYPTDSTYALGCGLGNKQALERIRQLRQLDKYHNFTLVCRDLSELSSYAQTNNSVFRLLKAYTPGPYTFILPATREVPRRLQHYKRKTIGLRVPDHPVCQSILELLAAPLMSATLIIPPHRLPLADPEDIYQALHDKVDVIVDSGSCGLDPTTVVDLTSDEPHILRQGKGKDLPFQ